MPAIESIHHDDSTRRDQLIASRHETIAVMERPLIVIAVLPTKYKKCCNEIRTVVMSCHFAWLLVCCPDKSACSTCVERRIFMSSENRWVNISLSRETAMKTWCLPNHMRGNDKLNMLPSKLDLSDVSPWLPQLRDQINLT